MVKRHREVFEEFLASGDAPFTATDVLEYYRQQGRTNVPYIAQVRGMITFHKLPVVGKTKVPRGPGNYNLVNLYGRQPITGEQR